MNTLTLTGTVELIVTESVPRPMPPDYALVRVRERVPAPARLRIAQRGSGWMVHASWREWEYYQQEVVDRHARIALDVLRPSVHKDASGAFWQDIAGWGNSRQFDMGMPAAREWQRAHVAIRDAGNTILLRLDMDAENAGKLQAFYSQLDGRQLQMEL